MKNQHVNPEDAVQLMMDLDAKQAYGVHWGTFALTKERLDDPPKDIVKALVNAQISPDRVWLLKHGETRLIET